jgi:ribosomal protein L37AE/L43A
VPSANWTAGLFSTRGKPQCRAKAIIGLPYEKVKADVTCTRCNHDAYKRFGYFGKKRIQRWKCTSCNASFSEPHTKLTLDMFCFQQEAVAPESRCRLALRLLQFLSRSWFSACHSRDGSGVSRSHLEHCGIAYDNLESSDWRLEQMLFLISYDINEKDAFEYDALWAKLREIGATRILYSEWVVTGSSASQIYDKIAPCIQVKDRLLVQEVTSNASWDKLLIGDDIFRNLVVRNARG